MATWRMITKAAARSLQNAPFWMINFGVIIVCFLSGPFGTFEALPNGFRLIYWGSIVLTTSLLAVWMGELIRARNWVALSKIAAVSIVFAMLVAGLVILISLCLLHPIQKYPGHIALLSYSFPSAAVIFFLFALVMRSKSMPGKDTDQKRPPLLNRLEKYPDAEKILSLSAQDHYVEVTTELGAELCLLRLSDAIAQTVPEDGFQIHRSHWIAKSAIVELKTKGATGQVRLTDGRTLNVSQSRLADFKDYLEP